MGERGGPGDPYSRVDYRRMIAWEKRIAREGPFLREALAKAPDASVLDLGCGTGEHVLFFASRGARAMGLDRSASMIEAAREHEDAGPCRFVLGDACDAPRLLVDEPRFGLALCLGNMLPHLVEEEQLDAFARAACDVLLPGGLLLLQILNYHRILEAGLRHLPLNFRPGDEDTEIVFLRLLRPREGGRILFFPTTLVLDPDADDPVSVRSSKRVELRAWREHEILGALAGAGLEATCYGDMQGGAWEPAASSDLVLLARRPIP